MVKRRGVDREEQGTISKEIAGRRVVEVVGGAAWEELVEFVMRERERERVVLPLAQFPGKMVYPCNQATHTHSSLCV